MSPHNSFWRRAARDADPAWIIPSFAAWLLRFSRELFEDILKSEEEHVDFLETQLGLIQKIGVENYIQLQSEHAE